MSRLFYKQSAGFDWNKALPVGNGKLGGMIFGNTDCEHIQLNEDSLWYGGPMNRVNPDALEHLEEVRNYIFNGKISEAQEIMLHCFSGIPQSERTYSTLGDLYINYHGLTEYSDYERELDLNDAVFRLRKKSGGDIYREEIFVNAPSNVMVIRLYNDNSTPFDVDVNYGRMTFYDSSFHDADSVYALGSMVGDDYRFAAGITYLHIDGEVSCRGEYIVARKVSELVILFTAATTFREKDPLSYVRSTLSSARAKEYAVLLEEHTYDYHNLFQRSRINLCYDSEMDFIPTDERLHLYNRNNPDNGLVTTYFDFGKYLLISSSREGSLPANLQGIWNGSINPPWGSKFTININTEMNYWPAEKLGLSECHLPLFDLMLRMNDNGMITAQNMYGCRGTVAHHNTDIWGDTAPQDGWIPATYWVMGMAWLCTHIWEHYVYTNDRIFLEKMYPVMYQTVLFFHDFLIEKDDCVILCPSLSPENTYILPNGEKGHVCYNSTMDMCILRDLFEDYLKAAVLLEDSDEAFLSTTRRLLTKIPKLSIGRFGQIMEWPEDYEEEEPGHRHISQLYALYPSNQILADDKDQDLIEGAKATLKRRLSFGGGHTGWSRAWIMNMYARLWDNVAFYDNLTELLKRSTLDNLFDNHPPFQIDGNFGAISAIAEAFLQSNEKRVILMPAVPKEWGCGTFTGIRAYGGASYSLTFQDGKLLSFTVKAECGDYQTNVRYLKDEFPVSLSHNEVKVFNIFN